MRKNMKKVSIVLSAILFSVSFIGCSAEDNVSVNNTTTEINVSENMTENENTEDIAEIENDNSGMVKEDADLVVSDKSYIYKDLCKVGEEYEELAEQAPLNMVIANLKKESYQRMTLLTHSVDESDGKIKDNISYKAVLSNPTGLVSQEIICNAVFEKESEDWKIISNEWKEWEIKTARLKGSNWHLISDGSVDLSKWFGEEVAKDEEGEIYIHFKKNIDFIAALKGDDLSVFETKVGTKCTGTMVFVNEEKKLTTDFSCFGGKTGDDGILSLILETEAGENELIFNESLTAVSQPVFDAAKSDNPEELPQIITFEDLTQFEVTSESIVYGEWKKECGSYYGNINPELSWEENKNAGCYLIVMVDIDDAFQEHLHWIEIVENNHVGAGASDRTTYIGPYPPSSREFTVYVFALKEKPDNLGLKVDSMGCVPEDLIQSLDKEKSGNILSYGCLTGAYGYTIIR